MIRNFCKIKIFFLCVCVCVDFRVNGWNKGSYLLEEERF